MPVTTNTASSEAVIAIRSTPANINTTPKSFTQAGAASRLMSPKPTVVTTVVAK